jgi:hypothetical protein
VKCMLGIHRKHSTGSTHHNHHTNHNTILTHHEHFGDLAHLGLPHQNDISCHQSAGTAFTVTSHPTIWPLDLVRSVLNSPTLQFFRHCHHHSSLIPHTVSHPLVLVFVSIVCHPPLNSPHCTPAYLVKLSVHFTFYSNFTFIFC